MEKKTFTMNLRCVKLVEFLIIIDPITNCDVFFLWFWVRGLSSEGEGYMNCEEGVRVPQATTLIGREGKAS